MHGCAASSPLPGLLLGQTAVEAMLGGYCLKLFMTGFMAHWCGGVGMFRAPCFAQRPAI